MKKIRHIYWNELRKCNLYWTCNPVGWGVGGILFNLPKREEKPWDSSIELLTIHGVAFIRKRFNFTIRLLNTNSNLIGKVPDTLEFFFTNNIGMNMSRLNQQLFGAQSWFMRFVFVKSHYGLLSTSPLMCCHYQNVAVECLITFVPEAIISIPNSSNRESLVFYL